jgi:multisubunit Na+/H+ antiporter MnhE subunit
VPKRTNLGGLRPHLLPWLGWWALSMALWLLLTSTVNGAEAIVGVGASAVTATATELIRAHGAFGFRPRVRWVLLALRIPIRIATDTVKVFGALVMHITGRKRVRGSWRAVPFRYGREGDARDVARRGFAIIGISISPNSVALDIDPQRNELLIHQLVSAPHDPDATLGRSR